MVLVCDENTKAYLGTRSEPVPKSINNQSHFFNYVSVLGAQVASPSTSNQRNPTRPRMKNATPLLLFSIFFLVACENLDVSKLTQEDINKLIVCPDSYMRFASGCCLDVNGNGICDDDEKVKPSEVSAEVEVSEQVKECIIQIDSEKVSARITCETAQRCEEEYLNMVREIDESELTQFVDATFTCEDSSYIRLIPSKFCDIPKNCIVDPGEIIEPELKGYINFLIKNGGYKCQEHACYVLEQIQRDLISYETNVRFTIPDEEQQTQSRFTPKPVIDERGYEISNEPAVPAPEYAILPRASEPTYVLNTCEDKNVKIGYMPHWTSATMCPGNKITFEVSSLEIISIDPYNIAFKIHDSQEEYFDYTGTLQVNKRNEFMTNDAVFELHFTVYTEGRVQANVQRVNNPQGYAD